MIVNIIILLAWSLSCITLGAGTVMTFHNFKINRYINRILDLEDLIEELNNTDDEDKFKYLQMELEHIIGELEKLAGNKDFGLISDYDYEMDLKRYERRIDEIEEQVKESD